MLTFEQLLDYFGPARQKAGSGYNVKCPAHDDRAASLSISESDDRYLLHCHAGCSFESVLSAINLDPKELFKNKTSRVTATYDYTDENGGLLYQVLRWEPKKFTQRRPDGQGGWINNLQGINRTLYRLHEVIQAREIIFVEGEKDAETAKRMGFCGTTTGSASTWRPELAKYLERKTVWIIPDGDEPGAKYAAAIAESLYGKSTVKIVTLEGAKDLTAWGERGGVVRNLKDLIAQTPEWKPTGAVEIVKPGEILNDMPEECLTGRLGEICQRRMKGFPLAFAWSALITIAGTMVRRSRGTLRQNLYTALVGHPHTGKSQAIDQACAILGIAPPEMQNVMSGSAEGLLGKLKDAGGCARLVSVDELGHLLSKAHIENASFPYVLNRAFYATLFDLTTAKSRQITFNCEMSLLGGCVTEQFDKLFDAATTGGLYDRFLFGMCPEPFEYHYAPLEGGSESISSVEVGVHPEVWEAKKEWKSEPRCTENALRVAGICAGIDGNTLLTPDLLGPAQAFADYQTRVRALLRPNPGENSDAKCAFAARALLERLGSNGSSGKWLPKRDLYRMIHADRLGPSVFRRAMESLVFNGDVEIHTEGKKTMFRIGNQ